MNLGFVLRQGVTLVRTVAEHVGGDPVFFGMQVARRLPGKYVAPVGRAVSRVPVPAVRATGLWLSGQESRASACVQEAAGSARGASARVLGEIALGLGLKDEALELAGRAGARGASATARRGAAGLRARLRWAAGDMSGAIEELPAGRYRTRLESERAVMTPGWTPAPAAAPGASRTPALLSGTPAEAPRTQVLFSLTNSLPHTQSGYTLRTHAVLRAVRDAGIDVLGSTRTGYPVSVGRFSSRDRDTIGGITYLRDVPWNQGSTLAERLGAQAAFLEEVGRDSGAQVLHTTTHFINGLAVREAARRLGVPWVYEVRGVLEETWASGRGSAEDKAAARESERFRLFRAQEIDVARSADFVVTLGHTMAQELVNRGVDASRVLVAPNAVGEAVLDADVTRPAAQVREELGLPAEGTWVGTAASIVGYEGLDTLVDAVALARADGHDLRLLVVGTGTELPTLRERAAVLGEHAVFTGRVPQAQAHAYVRALDVFVVPRRNDPVCALVTPIKPVEAAGLGRPVVVSDLPALTEALPAGAFTAVPPEEPGTLASELVRLAQDPLQRARMAATGRDFVLAERRWESVAQGFVDMYAKLGVEVGSSVTAVPVPGVESGTGEGGRR